MSEANSIAVSERPCDSRCLSVISSSRLRRNCTGLSRRSTQSHPSHRLKGRADEKGFGTPLLHCRDYRRRRDLLHLVSHQHHRGQAHAVNRFLKACFKKRNRATFLKMPEVWDSAPALQAAKATTAICGDEGRRRLDRG